MALSRPFAAGHIRVLGVVKGLCIALVVSWMLTFENMAELKFFGRGLIPFAGIPFEIYTALFGPEDAYLVLSCDQMSNMKLLQTTQNPILFKHCIPNPQNLTMKDDFVTFPSSSTNLFPSCGKTEVVRYFKYTSIEGDERNIAEKIPCASSTLEEKIQFHQQHEPTRDVPYFDVNVLHLSVHDELALEKDFKRKGFLPHDFSFAQLASATVLGHFFGSGMTPVDYYHSHMDRFFSFGIQTTKVWDLINPKYHGSFEYQWSGNAIVLTKEKHRVPCVVVEQEPGDVLFVSPWWLHKTRYQDPANTLKTKNLNFNLHIMTARSLSGLGAHIFMRWLNMSNWFYASNKNKKAYRDYGLTF